MNHSVFESDSTFRVTVELKGKERMEVFYVSAREAKQFFEEVYLSDRIFVAIETAEKIEVIQKNEIRLIEFTDLKKEREK